MKKYDVIALGELLIDFTQNGISKQDNPLLEANPGGAPGNVLAMLQKLGKQTQFIGKVGDDVFGKRLIQVLKEEGIGTQNISQDPTVPTTLAFVATMPDGDRSFSFYRNPGADMMLRKEEVLEKVFKEARLFHFGSLSMTDEPVREATKYAICLAEKHQLLRSFDPNLREPLWNSMDEAREMIAYGMAHCDILKISDNELVWFTGEENFTKGVEVIRKTYDIPLILVSMGKRGSRAYYRNGSKDLMVEEAPFLQKNTIETTGAGDTFGACVISYVLDHGLVNLSSEMLSEMLTFANAAASLVTTRKGALRVMPSKSEVMELMKSSQRH